MKRWIPLRHIQTKPPIPFATIEGFIRDIEQSKELVRDGKILGTALKFAYVLGFRKREILELRIEHVLDENLAVRSAIIFDGEQISIPVPFTQTIADYCSYLRKYRKKLLPHWPFFPDRKRDKPYDEATIGRHINHFSKIAGCDITFEKIRQSGICRFYDLLGAIGPGQSVQEVALSKTAKFARVKSIIHAYNILIGKIDPPGKRTNSSAAPSKLIPAEDPVERIRAAVNLSETAAMEIIEKDLPKIGRSLSKIAELRNEFFKAISGAASLDSPVKARLVESFDAHLLSIGFMVNQADGSLSVLEDFIYED